MAITNKLTAIANALRSVNATSGTHTMTSMASAITGMGAKYVPSTYAQKVSYAETLVAAQGGTFTNLFIADTDASTTIGFMTNNFAITSFNQSTTNFTASGWWCVGYNKATEEWSIVDYTATASPSGHFINNFKFANCVINYSGNQIYPAVGRGVPWSPTVVSRWANDNIIYAYAPLPTMESHEQVV